MNPGRRSFLVGASTLTAAITAVAGRANELEPSAPAASDASAPVPKGGVSRFARVNGIDMHYVTVGAGPALVLLHGWPQTWFAWRNVMERLSTRFTLIAPDLRGLGLTQRTADGYDKRTIAADIRALIDEAAGGRAHVVGHDMGGKAAFTLAHLHPERVNRLVLVDCLIPGTENMDALRGGAWHYGFHMAPDFPEMLTKGREREYIAAQIRAWSHKKDAIAEAEISEFARHYATEGGMTAGFNYYRALRDDAALAASFGDKRLEMPVLTIAGRYGVGARLSEGLQGRAQNLTSLIAEDSGHFVAEEAPEYFCEKVSQFLSS
ncbi:alpha/beta fold hydrolase [Methylocystis bryophila]|uniref:Alpha/beta hydrolase n=1 Tax=Methylocystis bryophila TaxID=655015 RepID=A0A1W6N0J9_9HYPH|nr:alpha/beta hydrolase [Methylocystis bryophila]ARN83306.1 alpha/beta hydrolase [Methylocystis bryophila]BDV40058.1 epoxide hydrolase [Methylocystis bryophila]